MDINILSDCIYKKFVDKYYFYNPGVLCITPSEIVVESRNILLAKKRSVQMNLVIREKNA